MKTYYLTNQESVFQGEKGIRLIGAFEQVNVLTGSNNSGKSRFLRELFTNPKNFFNLDNSWADRLESNARLFKTNFRNAVQPNGIKSSKSSSSYAEIIRRIEQKPAEWLRNLSNYAIDGNLKHLYNDATLSYSSDISDRFKDHSNNILNNLISGNSTTRSMYIPILRGLRPLKKEGNQFRSDDVYSERTRIDYTINEADTRNIQTGLNFYDLLKKHLLGTKVERDLIKSFELFLERHIFDEPVTLIPRHESDTVEIQIGEAPQLPVYQLGDGIQALLIMLFPIFLLGEEPARVFIEEPETHLHPKWQRKFLQCLREFPNVQFFFTTHSAVLINDASTTVFRLAKIGDNEFQVNPVFDQKEVILQELGYLPSDLLTTNYALWVEGPSDKLYLSNWIRQVDPQIVEGDHYRIMLFGGEQFKNLIPEGDDRIPDFSILKSLNVNFGIVLDSDKTSQNDTLKPRKQDIQSACEKLGYFCFITGRRELENYIPQAVFETAVKRVHSDILEVKYGHYDDIMTQNGNAENLKQTIKLSNEFFQKLQKDGVEKIASMKVGELRAELTEALEKTKSSVTKLDKMKVAREVCSGDFELDEQIGAELKRLIQHIRKANGLE